MAACLNCHIDLTIEDRNLGTIFTCPNCNAVFFCGWDGALESAQHPAEPAIESHSSLQGHATLENDSSFEKHASVFEEHASASEAPHELVSSHEVAPEPGFAQVEDSFKSTNESNHDFSNSLHNSSPTLSGPVGAAESFKEITDYANNNDVAMTEVSYRLVIEGIDTSKIHETIVEAISDSKFGWDRQEIVDRIKDGKLEFRNLNPAKTSVLVNRIKHLEILIRWYYE